MSALQGQVALVTGASRGIGRAIAEALGTAGATVVGTATSEAGAQAISQRLAAANFTGEGAVLDVNDTAAIEPLLAGISERHGAVSLLVNNAGITRDTLLLRMKDEDWQAVIDTNLTSVFRLSRAVLKPMIKARAGRIINITSVVGQTGNAGQANYAAAKAGLLGFTRSMAREVGVRGITVNAIAPGFIESDMTAALGEEQRAALYKQIALGRLGQASDVAAACVFLASGAAGYITGHTLNVNGGMFMQ